MTLKNMAIFNSLGSNYSFGFAVRALLALGTRGNRERLLRYLEKRYGGDVILVYKGREAIRLALRAIDMSKKYTVGICGYNCYAVYEAVSKEGYGVRYLDIDETGLNFSLETVKKMLQNSPSMRILIIQNTLGYTADILSIVEFCRERGIIIIEDLAHCVGATYSTGQEVGTVGDFTMLSFSQDKMVDGVSGGALVIRNEQFQIPACSFSKIRLSQQLRDRFYPLFTYFIRKTYGSGFGKVLHLVLKRLHWLSMPMNHLNTRSIYGLPSWYCALIYQAFVGLKDDLIHRRKIASIYVEEIDKSLLFPALTPQVPLSANLRFPLLVKERESLLRYLKSEGIYVIGDIWFDSPIAPKKYLQLTDYKKGDCPQSEKISDLMVNLPVHGGVSERDAEFIAAKVNYWLQRRDK